MIKKIGKISAVIIIMIVVLFGLRYIYGQIRMNNFIKESVEDIEDSYYKGLASTCFKKDESQYRCCISSVYSMMDVDAKLIKDIDKCLGRINQLKCSGSFKWCEEVVN